MNKQEFFPNGSLDHWLREQADGHDPLPADDGWDLPSEQVWTAVKSKLQRRRRRRLIFFWWLLLGALLGGGALVWHFERPAGHRERRLVVGVPSRSTKALVNLDSSSFVSTSSEVNPNPSPEKERYHPAEGNLPALPGEGRGLKKREKTPTHAISILNKAATPPATKNTKANGSKNILHTSTGTTLLSFQNSVPNPAPLALRPLPALARFPKLPPGSIQASLKKTSKSWTFGASGGYFFTSRTLRGSTDNHPNGSEHGTWTWQGGLLARRAFTPHWSLESGLQWTSIRLRAERSGSIRFRTNQERYDPAREVYQTTARQQLQTSFGAVQMRFDISRQAGQTIDDQEIIRLRLSTDEQVRYLRLPLALRYSKEWNRWRWGAQIGGGLSLRTGYELDLKAGSSDRLAIVGVQARAERRAAGLAKFVGDFHFAVDVGYQITPRLALHLAPEIRHGFSSLYRKGPFASYPVTTGLQSGFTLKFN